MIQKCPTCGSRKLKLVKKDYRGVFKGRAYVAPGIEFHECPVCGEQLFGGPAMRRIHSFRPVIHRRRRSA